MLRDRGLDAVSGNSCCGLPLPYRSAEALRHPKSPLYAALGRHLKASLGNVYGVSTRGCQSSTLLPSGSVIQAKWP